METNIWDIPSIDEYWDNLLRGKEKDEQLALVDKQVGLLKEWLLLKIKQGVGNRVVIREKIPSKKREKHGYFDIVDYDAYCRVKQVLGK